MSYTAHALVFDVKELLLGELHVQEVLKDESITDHGTLQKQEHYCEHPNNT